jgi:hypothetical protein
MRIEDIIAEAITRPHRRREPGLADILAEMLSALPTEDEHQMLINEAIEELQVRGILKNLQPVTVRSFVRIKADTVFIGAEGFPEGHPHTNLLVRSPKKMDRWRLWSLCPGKKVSRGFNIKNVSETEEAVRIANIVLDLGLHLIDEETYLNAARKTRDERRAAREAEQKRGQPMEAGGPAVAAEAPAPNKEPS